MAVRCQSAQTLQKGIFDLLSDSFGDPKRKGKV
jgi:hypothetical protein